jgi:hypothetical protein
VIILVWKLKNDHTHKIRLAWKPHNDMCGFELIGSLTRWLNWGGYVRVGTRHEPQKTRLRDLAVLSRATQPPSFCTVAIDQRIDLRRVGTKPARRTPTNAAADPTGEVERPPSPPTQTRRWSVGLVAVAQQRRDEAGPPTRKDAKRTDEGDAPTTRSLHRIARPPL